MSESKRRNYAEEFKTEAVRLVCEAGKPVAQVARELGISANLLYRCGARSARRGAWEPRGPRSRPSAKSSFALRPSVSDRTSKAPSYPRSRYE